MNSSDTRTRAQRWADRVTEFSGSWPFIGWFAAICVLWIIGNTTGLFGFDPYPFLFLNWALTMVSTFQSPLILLSQNRQNEVDRANVAEMIQRLRRIEFSLSRLHVARIEEKLEDMKQNGEQK